MRRVVVLIIAVSAGCAPKTPKVELAEKVLPQTFAVDGLGASAAEMDWRAYFGDPALNALIAEGLANNPDLLIALQRVELARAGVKRATGALLPQVNLALGASLRRFGRYTMDGAGNATTDIRPGQVVPANLPDFLVGFTASWEVDLWGKLRNERKSAIAQYLASLQGTNFALTSLIADIASTYYQLIAFDHLHAILEQTASRQADGLEAVRAQKAAGRANELAVQQFEAQVSETRAAEVAARQQVTETENALNLLLGRFPQPIARSREALFAEIPERIAAGVPSDLLRNRADVREAELEVEASRFDVAAARAAFLPSLNITAGIGYQAFNPRFLFTTPESLAYSVMGGLVAPLLNRSALEAQFIGANALQLQAMVAYQKAILVAYADVVNGLSGLQRAREGLALKKEQKDALLRAIDTADALFRAGKASYLEVLIVQQSSLRADLELIETHQRGRLAVIDLYKALGGGWHVEGVTPDGDS